MFDFTRIMRRFVDKAFQVTHLDERGDLTDKDKDRIRNIGYKVMPLLLQVVTFLTLMLILTTIKRYQGFEIAVLTALAIVILRMPKI